MPVRMLIKNMLNAFTLADCLSWPASSFVTFFHSSRCGSLYLHDLGDNKKGQSTLSAGFVFTHVIAPVVIVNVSFREQRFLVAQHPVDVNHGALFVENSCACYIVIVERPNAFIEFVAHVRESDGPIIAIPIHVIFVEGAKRLADD